LGPGQSWALDVPGLTRADADELVSLIRNTGVSAYASAVNPAAFLTLHLDRGTVESLVRAISPGAADDGSSGLVILEGLVEILSDWLAQIHDVPT
jgi:hypothetical protein